MTAIIYFGEMLVASLLAIVLLASSRLPMSSDAVLFTDGIVGWTAASCQSRRRRRLDLLFQSSVSVASCSRQKATWDSRTPVTSRYASCRSLAAPYRLAHLKPLELGVIQIQRLVVPCSTMRSTERLRFGPRFKDRTAFPDRVRSIECVILSLGPLRR